MIEPYLDRGDSPLRGLGGDCNREREEWKKKQDTEIKENEGKWGQNSTADQKKPGLVESELEVEDQRRTNGAHGEKSGQSVGGPCKDWICKKTDRERPKRDTPKLVSPVRFGSVEGLSAKAERTR